MTSIVVMGVAGCGKSSVGAALAALLSLPLIEGDTFHSAANVAKMRAGIPLDDTDRAGWLAQLGRELQRHPAGAVLACSALKRAYRDLLRGAAPGLRFVHLEVAREEARRRVEARADGHYFHPDLIDSQFAALELPHGEANVLGVDATQPIDALARQVANWYREVG